MKTVKEDSDRMFYNVIKGKAGGYWLDDFVERFTDQWLYINTVENVRRACCSNATVLTSMVMFLSDAREE